MAKKAMICSLLQVQFWWSFHLLRSTCWPVREGSTASCTTCKLQHIQLVKQNDVQSADCLKKSVIWSMMDPWNVMELYKGQSFPEELLAIAGVMESFEYQHEPVQHALCAVCERWPGHALNDIHDDQAIACPSSLILPQRVALSSQAHCLCRL